VERWIDELKGGNVYILYYEGIPVCTARKRRPLRYGCTISIVYTPPEYRQKGYCSVCVSMLTELLLKEFKYVTLFADAERGPNNSIYTSAGYKIHSGAALYYTSRK
jgi:predicted GNAT family acetyltransferase